MQKIIPHLWYDKEAKEAAEFYVSLFDNAKILKVTVLEGTPSGDPTSLVLNLLDKGLKRLVLALTSNLILLYL